MPLPAHIETYAQGLRFKPSPRLVRLGFTRCNLEAKTEAEAWAWYENILAPKIAAQQAEAAKPKKKGRPTVALVAAKQSLTVGDAFEQLKQDPERFLDRKPKTRADYRIKAGWIERHYPEVYQRQLSAFTKQIASGLHADIRAAMTKKGRNPHAMANAIIAVLRLLWSFAHERGLIMGEQNPFGKLRKKGTPPRVRVWTPAELDAFLAVADEIDPATGTPRDPEMGDCILLGHELGQRQADICKLTWDCFDGAAFNVLQNKTGMRVAVPPTPELAQRLEAAKARRQAIAQRLHNVELAPTIVLSRHTGRPIVRENCTHRFAALRAVAAQRLPSCATVNYQDLRDTAVTNLANAGASVAFIASITGHRPASVAAILDHYLAQTSEQARGAIELLNAHRAKLRAAAGRRSLDRLDAITVQADDAARAGA